MKRLLMPALWWSVVMFLLWTFAGAVASATVVPFSGSGTTTGAGGTGAWSISGDVTQLPATPGSVAVNITMTTATHAGPLVYATAPVTGGVVGSLTNVRVVNNGSVNGTTSHTASISVGQAVRVLVYATTSTIGGGAGCTSR